MRNAKPFALCSNLLTTESEPELQARNILLSGKLQVSAISAK